MDISIFGFKLNLEVLILIGIVYLILVGHTVCGCCRMNNKEGYENTSDNLTQPMPSTYDSSSTTTTSSSSTPSPVITASPSGTTPASTTMATPTDVEMPSGTPEMINTDTTTTTTSTGGSKKKEGFTGANTNYGQSSNYSLTQNIPVNTSKWGYPSLVIVPGKPIPKAAQEIINRPNQSLPLPEGQLSLFDNMPFSPDCCPNTYSSSMGCACMNTNTYNYLITRGSNNVPYSEY
jgi:hypothetical protein